MGRKDRARARRRHAIERARRAHGEHQAAKEPEQEPEARRRPRSRSRPASGRQPGRAQGRGGARGSIGPRPVNPFATKAKVGDLDPRGRVRTRDMLVHPRITTKVVLFAFLLALPGAMLPLLTHKEQPGLQALTFVAFAVCFVGLADLARTRRWSVVMLMSATFSLVVGVSSLLGR